MTDVTDHLKVIHSIIITRLSCYMKSYKDKHPFAMTETLSKALGALNIEQLKNIFIFHSRVIEKFGHRRVLLFPKLQEARFLTMKRETFDLAVFLLNSW